MISIKVPTNNGVEIVIGDIYMTCDVRFLPVCPPQSTETKIAIESMSIKLNILANEILARFSKEFRSKFEEKTLTIETSKLKKEGEV